MNSKLRSTLPARTGNPARMSDTNHEKETGMIGSRSNNRWTMALAVLAAAFLLATPAPASAGKSELRLKVKLVNTGEVAKAKGIAEFRERVDRMEFKVKAQGLEGGSYDLLVNGAPEGTLNVSSKEKGEAEFRSNPEAGEDEQPLTFDPRGQLVQVAQGSTIFLSVVFPQGSLADLSGSGAKVAPVDLEVALVPTGAIPGADGKVRFRSKDGRDQVRVEIEDVPDGDYVLRVAGNDEGVIVVQSGEGELEFDTQAKNGKLPLTFDPRGQLVEVLLDGTTVLQVVFPQS